jgi:hypothetical protein
METPADTLSYFIAGYTVIFTVLAVYLASLFIRFRNLKQDEELLKELEEKNK